MKILTLSIALFFLIATSAIAGSYEPFEAGVLVASSHGNGSQQQPSSGKVVIKGKGGKVTDVEQKPDAKKKKKKDK